MEPFKNLISPALVGLIADQLAESTDRKTANRFRRRVLLGLDSLELKDRVQCVADALLLELPEDAAKRHAVLGRMLHPEASIGLSRSSDSLGIAGWGIWPLSQIVGQHGLDDFEGGLRLLSEMTQRSTAEFAIRYFLLADQERALATIIPWAKDGNEDVRRLASEGTRPRLPWGMRLTSLVKDPAPTLPLLEALRDDSSEYVRRSVANHLNDIAKDHPELVIKTARAWLKGKPSTQRKRLVRHACRTLIKQGNKDVMALFGFPPPKAEFSAIALSAQQVHMGENLTFEISIKSCAGQSQQLSIDYVLHLLKAKGTHSSKVFKGGVVSLLPGDEITFSRTHKFRQVTTRRYYPGTQGISLRINGIDTAKQDFELVL